MVANKTIHQAALAKWTALFQEQKSSGLAIKEWCSKNNVSIHAYYYWKRIAKEEYVRSIIPDIVPLPIPSDPIAESISSVEDIQSEHKLYNSFNSGHTIALDSTVSISMNDIRIEIGPETPDALITKIIGALRHA